MIERSLSYKLLKLGLIVESSAIPYLFHSVVIALRTSSKVPQEWIDTTTDGLDKNRDGTKCGNYGGNSLVHTGELVVKIVANRPGSSCEEAKILPEELCGYRPQRLAADMVLVVHRLQELGRSSNISSQVLYRPAVGVRLRRPHAL